MWRWQNHKGGFWYSSKFLSLSLHFPVYSVLCGFLLLHEAWIASSTKFPRISSVFRWLIQYLYRGAPCITAIWYFQLWNLQNDSLPIIWNLQVLFNPGWEAFQKPTLSSNDHAFVVLHVGLSSLPLSLILFLVFILFVLLFLLDFLGDFLLFYVLLT